MRRDRAEAWSSPGPATMRGMCEGRPISAHAAHRDGEAPDYARLPQGEAVGRSRMESNGPGENGPRSAMVEVEGHEILGQADRSVERGLGLLDERIPHPGRIVDEQELADLRFAGDRARLRG